jgi:D-arabinose 1-dehydrogenase-like Zn-dependent alcohol dehydrogenase
MPSSKIRSYAAQTADSPLAPFEIARREPGPSDVEIDILFCGVCHSDLHQARNEWHNTIYPCVPGHEIVGRVTRVGNGVKAFEPGDLAGVGCMVDSCRTCVNCKAGMEVYCRRSFAGSAIGGIAETQEMLDFCAKHAIASDIEMIPIQKINDAYDRLLRQDVRYRFVIDMASLKSAPA